MTANTTAPAFARAAASTHHDTCISCRRVVTGTDWVCNNCRRDFVAGMHRRDAAAALLAPLPGSRVRDPLRRGWQG
jgi:hypothetical protein